MVEYRCFYCGHVGAEDDFETEHFVSREARKDIRGANHFIDERGIYAIFPDTAEVCYKCNRSKQEKSMGEWARWLANHPGKWYPWDDGDRRWFVQWYLGLP